MSAQRHSRRGWRSQRVPLRRGRAVAPTVPWFQGCVAPARCVAKKRVSGLLPLVFEGLDLPAGGSHAGRSSRRCPTLIPASNASLFWNRSRRTPLVPEPRREPVEVSPHRPSPFALPSAARATTLTSHSEEGWHPAIQARWIALISPRLADSNTPCRPSVPHASQQCPDHTAGLQMKPP